MSVIDIKGEKCCILDDYTSDDSVPFEAAEYWYLDLFIIILDDMDGVFSSAKQKYMVLEYPSYTEVTINNTINDCIWSVPYMAYLFQKNGTKRYKSIKSIVKFYNEQIESHKELLDELENYRFYHMGISDYEKKEGRDYIEYKISARQPDKWKCYYIQEHYITQIDSLGLLNLADPEGLHSYRYYPLNSKYDIRNDEIYFDNKHLSSNVAHLIKSSYNKLMQYSNAITNKYLKYKLQGLIFKIDIVGFTKLYNKIADQMKSFDESGKEIAIHFVAGLSSIFENRMREFGVYQYTIEGDGITGVLPFENRNEIALILECITEIKKDIDGLAEKVRESICLRVALTSGEYFYGKLAGLSSSKQVSGEIFITLSRMDQFLQEYIGTNKEFLKTGIIICLNEQLYLDNIKILQDMKYTKVHSKEKYKETIIKSKLIYKED